jgi:hypothetical protein
MSAWFRMIRQYLHGNMGVLERAHARRLTRPLPEDPYFLAAVANAAVTINILTHNQLVAQRILLNLIKEKNSAL